LADEAQSVARPGRFEESKELYEQAIAFLRKIGEHGLLAETYARMGEMYVFAGDPDASMQYLEDARSEALAYTAALIDRVAGHAYAQLGDADAAWGLLTRSVIACRESNDEYGTALGLKGLSVVGQSKGPLAARLLADAEEIFARLDVVCTPDIPQGSLT
jgi:tetratricopeptide (TPR) repeat protein